MEQEYMEKTYKEKDELGQDVIYVEKCKKFKFEPQEIPINKIM